MIPEAPIRLGGHFAFQAREFSRHESSGPREFRGTDTLIRHPPREEFDMRLPNLLDAAVTQVNPRDADFVYNESAGHLKHLVGVYFFETSQHPAAEFTQAQAVDWVTARLGHNRMFTPPNPAHATGTRPSVLGSRPQPGCGRPRAGQRDFRAGLGTISRNAQRPADLENGSQPPTLGTALFHGDRGA